MVVCGREHELIIREILYCKFANSVPGGISGIMLAQLQYVVNESGNIADESMKC